VSGTMANTTVVIQIVDVTIRRLALAEHTLNGPMRARHERRLFRPIRYDLSDDVRAGESM